jgi:hypothetical protein
VPTRKRKLVCTVFVTDDKGIAHEFDAGDNLPAWAEKLVTNPACFEGEDDDEPDAPAPASRGARTAATTAQADSTEGTPEEDAPDAEGDPAKRGKGK